MPTFSHSLQLYVNIVPHPQKEQKITSHQPALQLILLGEDDLDDEELLKELFSSVDDSFSLVFINNGKKLIDFLSKAPDNRLPCLIVLDYNMPELNGEQILRELKNDTRYSHIPKIIWSTSKSDTFRRRCLEAGANDYMIKPASIQELVEMIRYMTSLC
ncbi:MAG TPA: response regulator [Chitinophagaceae bacterium]|nr:response regulator [Chitinophagaceae bacterium]